MLKIVVGFFFLLGEENLLTVGSVLMNAKHDKNPLGMVTI
jgi:hypothetical protein